MLLLLFSPFWCLNNFSLKCLGNNHIEHTFRFYLIFFQLITQRNKMFFVVYVLYSRSVYTLVCLGLNKIDFNCFTCCPSSGGLWSKTIFIHTRSTFFTSFACTCSINDDTILTKNVHNLRTNYFTSYVLRKKNSLSPHLKGRTTYIFFFPASFFTYD